MIGAFDNSTIEFGIADHSPSTVKHQAFIEDSWKMHPRLTLNYGLRYEPFIPFDQKGGRHTTWVPGVQSTVGAGRAARAFCSPAIRGCHRV